MKKKIFDASKGCQFTNRKIVLDTNVWIAIDGFDPRPRPDLAAYSNFYDAAKKLGNTIVVNDYILSELFNRACRIQYEITYDDDPGKKQFKARRKLPEFKQWLETVRDTCLNILDDCEYEHALEPGCDLRPYFEEAGQGTIDLSDIVIRQHCRMKDYVIVSHDGDFAGCGVDFVTANRKILRSNGH